MKKTVLSALLIGAVLVGCKKEEATPEEPVVSTTNPPTETVTLDVESTPSAQAADDNKSSGVYKGTFVGSSGSFKLTLETGDITGTLILDGVGYDLTTSDITTSDLGSAISNATFTDAEGTISVVFSVDADGQNPSVTLTITGHANIEAVVAKETSNNQITIYEGTTSWFNDGGCTSNLNLLLKINPSASFISKSTGLTNGDAGGNCSSSYVENNATYQIKGDSIRATYISGTDEIDVFKSNTPSTLNSSSNFAFFSDTEINCAYYGQEGKIYSVNLIRKL